MRACCPSWHVDVSCLWHVGVALPNDVQYDQMKDENAHGIGSRSMVQGHDETFDYALDLHLRTAGN